MMQFYQLPPASISYKIKACHAKFHKHLIQWKLYGRKSLLGSLPLLNGEGVAALPGAYQMVMKLGKSIRGAIRRIR